MDWGLVLEAAKLAAPYLANAARGASEGRQTQAVLQGNQDNQRADQYRTAQNAQMDAGDLDLRRKGYTEDVRLQRARQVALADALMGYSPTRVSVPGVPSASISGGFPGLSAGGREGANALKAQALAALLKGDDKFEGGKVLPQPGVTALPQPSGWEKAAGIIGHAGNLAGIADAAGVFDQKSTYVPQIGMRDGLPTGVGSNMGLPLAPPGQQLPWSYGIPYPEDYR